MNIFKWLEYKSLENHVNEINRHLGFLSASGIRDVPDFVYDIRNKMMLIWNRIHCKYQ